MRGLSERFMDDLKSGGRLNPILERVKSDHTLMLAIRKGYINIYYRGGNILRITEGRGFYRTFFDVKYGLGKSIANSEDDIRNQTDAQQLVTFLPDRKVIMDKFFAAKGNAEREFQQLVAFGNRLPSSRIPSSRLNVYAKARTGKSCRSGTPALNLAMASGSLLSHRTSPRP